MSRERLEAEGSDDGLRQVGVGEAQGPTDALTVDDFFEESAVERRRWVDLLDAT